MDETLTELTNRIAELQRAMVEMQAAHKDLTAAVYKMNEGPSVSTLRQKLEIIVRDNRLTRHGLAPKRGPNRAPKPRVKLNRLMTPKRRKRLKLLRFRNRRENLTQRTSRH